MLTNVLFFIVQFFIMMCHYMGSGDDSNTYLYMSLVYGSDFSPRVYSYFNLMGNCTGAVGTLIVMPFMANILKFHETSMGAIIQLLNTTGELRLMLPHTWYVILLLNGFYKSLRILLSYVALSLVVFLRLWVHQIIKWKGQYTAVLRSIFLWGPEVMKFWVQLQLYQ